MKQRAFEIHVTIEVFDRAKAKRFAKNNGVSYSEIDGDPVLGSGVRGYLTTHVSYEEPSTEAEMGIVAGVHPDGAIGLATHAARSLAELADSNGLTVRRVKVEEIVFGHFFAEPDFADVQRRVAELVEDMQKEVIWTPAALSKLAMDQARVMRKLSEQLAMLSQGKAAKVD